MARRQHYEDMTPAVEKRIDGDDKCVGPLFHQRHKCRIKVALAAGFQNDDLLPEGVSGCLYVPLLIFRSRIVRVHEKADRRGFGDQFVQQPQPLRLQASKVDGRTCHVAPWTVEAGDQTEFDWVAVHREDDWYR